MHFITLTSAVITAMGLVSTVADISHYDKPRLRTSRHHKPGITTSRTYSHISPYPTAPFTFNGGGEGIPATAFWGIPPKPTAAPYLENKREAKAEYNGQLFTIHIENRAGDSMQMNLKHNAGSPGAVCCPHNGPLPSSTQVTYPTGWAGRISIGPVADEDVITRGSTIEASFLEGKSFIAVSYASGYTYPVVCSCNGMVTTGCNYPLLAHAAENGGCPAPGNKICYNPDAGNLAKNEGSPAIPFFQPCQGAAYTYPKDHGANQGCVANEAFCCVGLLCPRNPRQHKG